MDSVAPPGSLLSLVLLASVRSVVKSSKGALKMTTLASPGIAAASSRKTVETAELTIIQSMIHAAPESAAYHVHSGAVAGKSVTGNTVKFSFCELNRIHGVRPLVAKPPVPQS